MVKDACLGVALVLVTLLGTGCGSDTLWARWRAERDLWRADHSTRVMNAGAEGLREAADRYRAVSERWPAATWVPRAEADSFAADVARIGARAAVRAAALTWAAGDQEGATAAFASIQRAWGPVWPAALEAALAHAAAAAATGDSATALQVREQLARRFHPIGPDGELLPGVLAAAETVARAHAQAGRSGPADSAWRALSTRLEAALASGPRRGTEPALWLALAGAQAELGPAGRAHSRVALERVLADSSAHGLGGAALLAMARLARADGDGAGAIRLARQARAALPWEQGLDAIEVEASVWERAGRIDSALATYGRAVDERWAPEAALTRARGERARLFEQSGRWQEARGELHALIAGDPLSRYAFRAMRRLVAHPLEHGEPDLAQLEVTWCVGRLEHTLATVLDPGVLLAARRTRADLLLAVDADRRAFAALEELWRRHPATPDGAWAALRAAELAERRLDDRAAAARLYGELAAGAPESPEGREAAARARRLAGGG